MTNFLIEVTKNKDNEQEKAKECLLPKFQEVKDAMKATKEENAHSQFMDAEHCKTIFLLNYAYMSKEQRKAFRAPAEIELYEGKIRKRDKSGGSGKQSRQTADVNWEDLFN